MSTIRFPILVRWYFYTGMGCRFLTETSKFWQNYWWLFNIDSGNGLMPSGARSMSPYGITRPQWVNTLRPGQNGLHFSDDMFQCIFLNEKIYILIKISLQFVPNGPINNIPSLVQIMAWHRPGNKPLSEAMMGWFTNAYVCHSASMS